MFTLVFQSKKCFSKTTSMRANMLSPLEGKLAYRNFWAQLSISLDWLPCKHFILLNIRTAFLKGPQAFLGEARLGLGVH